MSLGFIPMKIFFRKTLTFDEVVEGCKHGNRSCQSLLYHQTSGKMFSLCKRYMKENQLAEDMLQEGYIKIYDKISDYRGDGSFEGWMRRIFVNTCLEEIRRNRPTLVFEEELEERIYPASEISIDRFSSGDLLEMVQELSDGYRTIFNLYAIEGYSHNEISGLLGISESTSKSQLSRARGILRKKIESQQIESLTYVK